MADLSLSFDPNKISAASDSASDAISKCAANSDAASNAISKIAARSAVWDVACTHYDVEISASLTDSDGQDQDRTTGSTYTTQEADVFLCAPFYLTVVEWDLKGAATYTLTIDGVQFGDAYVAAGDVADAAFTGTRMLENGGHRFKLTRSVSGTWSDKNSWSFSDSIWSSDGIYYAAVYTNYYTLPIRLTGYVGVWEVCGTA